MTVERRRIAVVGGGVAGLTAAYVLQQGGCEVSLYEAAPGVVGTLPARLRQRADRRTGRGLPAGDVLAADVRQW
ncbi:hypothetical protein Sgleb_02180 [Streptomyces glebosus]|uniref:FAD dependent oxidoreductase domain-containing protein n=1 Tax=Streptomyces glebosus TaxID=249580 RepID=A0A640SPB8_9ACTN|nr:hypothetical protein Sgleb_02180 [Streptomyces glebosus]GHG84689.1 hypothetical protein GCM10010513_65080 [Streptomyces glebosus]